jgi:hypothetical protein
MKIAVVFSATAISFFCSVAVAQQVGASAQTSATANPSYGAGNGHVSQSSDVNASANRNGATVSDNAQSSVQAQTHPVSGELEGKLDSKTAKAGDQVVVKTSEAFRTSDGVTIPKGSRIVGHVTQVQAHGNGSQDSRLGIQFDRAELKNGESFHVQSMIESVAPPANAMAAASIDSSEDMGASAMGGGGRAMGGGRAGGGLLGGGASAVGSTTAGAGAGLGRTVGGSVDAASGLTGSAGAAVGNNLNGAAGATGSLATHATAVPGVMLQADAAGSASGVLSASKRNIHLDSGTQMTLGVAGAVGR